MPSHPYAYPQPLKKRAGSGPVPSNQQRNIFLTDADPRNPTNKQYIPVANASTYPSILVAGRKSPRVALHSCMKPYDGTHGWTDADLCNSLVHIDNTNNTDYFAMAFPDEVETRIYDYMRCDRLEFSGDARGGPNAVMMGFVARWGDQDAPYNTTLPNGEVVGAAPTFVTTATPDAGLATPATFITFTGLDTVMNYNVSFIRGQSPRYYYGGGPGPANIASTMFSGLLTVEQEADAATQIVDQGTLTINFNTDKTSTTGRFRCNLILEVDEHFKRVVTQIGTIVTTLSMMDRALGGNPGVFQAY